VSGYFTAFPRYLKPFRFYQALLFLMASLCLLLLRFWLISHFYDMPADTAEIRQRYQSIEWWQLVLLIPLLEELFFRYLLQGLILHPVFSDKPWIPIVLSAMLFGLAHFYPPMIAAAFVMGLFISWVFWKAKSIFAALFIHITNNFFIIIPSKLYPELEHGLLTPFTSPPALAASLIILLAVIYALNRSFNRQTA
jgi:membrane protease YdiL (CAAX protease family)